MLLLAIRADRYARSNAGRPPEGMEVIAGDDDDLLVNPFDGRRWAYDPRGRTLSGVLGDSFGEEKGVTGTVTLTF